MEWLCPGILVLSLVVGLIAVVGHGLWIFFAWLFRGRRCPRCGWRLGHYAEACEACGWLIMPGARASG